MTLLIDKSCGSPVIGALRIDPDTQQLSTSTARRSSSGMTVG